MHLYVVFVDILMCAVKKNMRIICMLTNNVFQKGITRHDVTIDNSNILSLKKAFSKPKRPH